MTSIYDCPHAHMHIRQHQDGSVLVEDHITHRTISIDGYTLTHIARPGQTIDAMIRQLARDRQDIVSAFANIRDGYRDWYAMLGIHAYPIMRLAYEIYDATKEMFHDSSFYDWYSPCSKYGYTSDINAYKESADMLWQDPLMRYSQYKMLTQIKGIAGVYTQVEHADVTRLFFLVKPILAEKIEKIFVPEKPRFYGVFLMCHAKTPYF